MSNQVLIHLPSEVARRFRLAVPARKRSAFVSKLIEQHLPDEDEQLYQLGLQAQAFDDAQPSDAQDWEATLMDGLDANETFDAAKLEALFR